MSKSVLVLGLSVLLLSTTCFGQEKGKEPQNVKGPPRELTEKQQKELAKKAMRAPTGAGFYIAPLEGTNRLFSLLLTDADGQSVTGTFNFQQVEVFEAVLEASRDFALSSEKVGTDKPIITRLMDQHEWSMFVDVSKLGDESRIYVSLITPTGKLTTEAGAINRASKKAPSALLFKMLSQIEEAKTANVAR